MPRKKKELETQTKRKKKEPEMPIMTTEVLSETKTAPEPAPPIVVNEVATVLEQGVCGHVNKHWRGAGEMTCELTKGHAGHHHSDMGGGGDWSNAVDG